MWLLTFQCSNLHCLTKCPGFRQFMQNLRVNIMREGQKGMLSRCIGCIWSEFTVKDATGLADEEIFIAYFGCLSMKIDELLVVRYILLPFEHIDIQFQLEY